LTRGALLSAHADSVCGAEYGVRSNERVNRRNGYRTRELDSRMGTIEVAIVWRLANWGGRLSFHGGTATDVSPSSAALVSRRVPGGAA
jgi:Transposase, Mutator family